MVCAHKFIEPQFCMDEGSQHKCISECELLGVVCLKIVSTVTVIWAKFKGF